MLTPPEAARIQKQLRGQDNNLPFIFNALGDSGRFKIFQILTSHKDVCVSDVANILDISVSAASQQLRILELVGLVKRVRMGQMICYELKTANLAVRLVIRLIAAWQKSKPS